MLLTTVFIICFITLLFLLNGIVFEHPAFLFLVSKFLETKFYENTYLWFTIISAWISTSFIRINQRKIN